MDPKMLPLLLLTMYVISLQVEEYSNRVANLFKSHGYRKGDSVALMMENRPEFVCMWLGLSKLGIITALINYNLRHSSLTHSVNMAKCQALIFGCELTEGTNISYEFFLYLQ